LPRHGEILPTWDPKDFSRTFDPAAGIQRKEGSGCVKRELIYLLFAAASSSLNGVIAVIKPGCRHLAVGRMRIIVACVPAFDPQDEWFD